MAAPHVSVFDLVDDLFGKTEKHVDNARQGLVGDGGKEHAGGGAQMRERLLESGQMRSDGQDRSANAVHDGTGERLREAKADKMQGGDFDGLSSRAAFQMLDSTDNEKVTLHALPDQGGDVVAVAT
eukprot:2593872-Pleurochrysis_carterae.AAC.1